jgi:hypothetical protein
MFGKHFNKGDLVKHCIPEGEPNKYPETMPDLTGIIVKEDNMHPGFYRVYWYTTSNLQVVFEGNLKKYED